MNFWLSNQEPEWANTPSGHRRTNQKTGLKTGFLIKIGDDFIQIISLRYQQGVHVENPDIARAMGQIFEMV